MHSQLFRNTETAGLFYLPPGRRDELDAVASRIRNANLESCTDGPAALAELGHALAFPNWYGANLDALHDCLTDPDWAPAPGAVLVINGLETLQLADTDALSSLIDVFASAADLRRDAGQPLWILIDTPAPGIPELPLP